MENKIDPSCNETQLPQKTPIFDIDDLSFLRFNALGLRHVELDLGIKEVQNGGFGDAVSLACYGRNTEKSDKHFILDIKVCCKFQEEVEQFILQSFNCYHQAYQHYNDAAFLLISRDEALFPYDFGPYPLGKCGKKEFKPTQVLSLIKTDGYINDDINHAVYNTLMNLKTVINQLKLQKAQELLLDLGENPELKNITQELINHYQINTFLEKPFFLNIAKICTTTNLPWELESEKTADIMTLTDWLQQINLSLKKGENTIKVLYEPIDFTSADAQTLSEQLIHFIENQNLKMVQLCILYLSKTGFNPAKDRLTNPLQQAARGESAEILKAVYEFEPSLYDELIANEQWSTPIFVAAYYSRLDNLKYLLSVRTIVSKDINYFDPSDNIAKHILVAPAGSNQESSLEVMQLLIKQGIGYGFDLKNDRLYENPLCMTARNWSNYELDKKKFDLILPHADAWAKYLGILTTTSELYYCYGRGPRTEFNYTEKRINRLFELRNQILASLSEAECEEIRCIMINKDKVICSRAEDILLADLLDYELKINPDNNVSASIQRCFANLEKNNEIYSNQAKTTFFQANNSNPQQPTSTTNECRIS